MAGLAIIIADIAEPSYNGRLLGNNPIQFSNGVAGALMAIEWRGGNGLCVEAIVEEVDNRVPISADEYFVLAERVRVATGVKLVVVHELTVACPIDPVNSGTLLLGEGYSDSLARRLFAARKDTLKPFLTGVTPERIPESR